MTLQTMTMIDQKILTSPHWHDGSSVRSTMLWVCLALLPGLICYTWYFGIGVIVQCLLAMVFAIIIETLLLKVRKQNLAILLQDGSVIVTAILFALMITPFTPWWINFIGVSFGLIFAKHIYGGLGNNLFNPAAIAFVFILLCFPVAMNHWPQLMEHPLDSKSVKYTLENIFATQGNISTTNTYDATSSATPLADMQNRLADREMISEITSTSKYGKFGGSGWEWINLFYLLGGIGLILIGVISWHVPVAVLGGLFAISLVFNMYDTNLYPSALFHLFSGGSMLAAFFVATDPVTSSATPTGKLIYGAIIGILIYMIRTWGAYPDGIAFAVIIANGMVPMIDEYTKPHVVGEG